MLAKLFHQCTKVTVLTAVVVTLLWKGGKAIDATWLLACIAIIAALDIWFQRNRFTKHLWFVPALLLILNCWTFISWLYSTTSNYGFGEVLHTASLSIICMWATYTWAHATRESQKAMTSTVVITLTATYLVSAIIGVLVYIFQPVNRFVGTFFDYRFHTDYWPNAWGDAVLLLLPIALWTIWQRTILKTKQYDFLLKITVSGFLLATLFLSYSRGSVIAATGQLGLFIIGVLLLRYSWRHVQKIFTGAIVTLLMAVTFFSSINAIRSGYHEVESVASKVTFTASEGAISVNERAQFWQQSVTLINERPWFGWGPYSFRFVQPQLQQHVLATSDHSHNVFIKYALERGVVAAIALFAFLLLIVSRFIVLFSIRALRKKIEKDQVFLYISFIALAGVIAHNLIDYNLQFVGISLLLWLIIGVLAAYLLKKPAKYSAKYWYGIAAILLIAVLARESYYMVYSSLGRRAIAQGNTDAGIVYFTKSLPQWFSRDLHVGLMDAAIHDDQPLLALNTFDLYRVINTQDARAWKLRGDACRALRDYECAKQSYVVAYEMNKYNDIGIVRWYIQTLVDTQELSTIDAMMPEVDALINEYQYAILNGVHHIGLSNNVEELSSLLNLLARLYSNKATMYDELNALILQKAKKDRDFVDGRTPGLLW